MDKQSKPKIKILKLLPKAASAVTFHNPPFSPGRDKRPADHHTSKLRAYAGRGFSGPMKISIIPDEARTKSKNSSFETHEPTSPKVSCIGQIKHKKKMKELAKRASAKIPEPKTAMQPRGPEKKRPSAIQRMFSSGKLERRKSNAAAVPGGDHDHDKPPLPNIAPPLSQMKRFSSGRAALGNFDWTAQIAPVDLEGGNYHSDEERGESENEEGEDRIPFSAPTWISETAGPLQPRKEVNLWKRRTIVPPRPLELAMNAAVRPKK